MNKIQSHNVESKKKIYWAVEPLHNPKDSENIIKELRLWSKRLNCEVQPITVFSKSTIISPFNFGFSWKDELTRIATVSIETYLKKCNVKEFLKPEIIYTDSSSTREKASVLAKFVENKHGLLIFANSRARKTWNPFRLGGFSETLAATSRTPILLVNPKIKLSRRLSSILFATDFSTDSKNALLALAPWAKALKSNILLFNQVDVPNFYNSEYGDPSLLTTIQTTTKNIVKASEKSAISLSKILDKHNVKNSVAINQQKKYVAEEIVNTAKRKKADLIVITSRTGLLVQTILGGITRDVLLMAHCPVLIFYRPKRHLEISTEKVHTKIPNGEIHTFVETQQEL